MGADSIGGAVVDNRISSVALRFLNMEIAKTEFSPIVVQHPFTNSAIVMVKDNNNENHIANILDNKDELQKWKLQMQRRIEGCTNVHTLFMQINRPWRLQFLSEAADYLGAKDFGELLAFAYTDDEFPSSNIKQSVLVNMFRKAKKEYLMEQDELAAYSGLPNTIEIYRGVQSGAKSHIKGMSWTTDKDTAMWFASRFGKKGVVYSAAISKKYVFAYFEREHEVVVDPAHLINIRQADI